MNKSRYLHLRWATARARGFNLSRFFFFHGYRKEFYCATIFFFFFNLRTGFIAHLGNIKSHGNLALAMVVRHFSKPTVMVGIYRGLGKRNDAPVKMKTEWERARPCIETRGLRGRRLILWSGSLRVLDLYGTITSRLTSRKWENMIQLILEIFRSQ